MPVAYFFDWFYNNYRIFLCCQETYIKDRSDAMESIEQTIVELGGIFSQLAHMVKEQEEEIKR